MSADENAPSDQAYCTGLVRGTDFERYATTLFLPPDQRRAALALLAFDIEVTGVRDHATQFLAGEIRLQWWADVLTAAARGDAERSPVAAELMQAVRDKPDVVAQLSRKIEAHRFDLYDEPMSTLAALEGYLGETFSTLFAPDAPDSFELVHSASLATGLVAVIERLPLHASRGQLYLPLDMIEQSGVRPEDIFAGVATPELTAVLQLLVTRANEYLRNALAALSKQPAGDRRQFLGLSLIERKLRAIAAPSYAPFAPDIRQSNLSILWTLWRATRRKPFAG